MRLTPSSTGSGPVAFLAILLLSVSVADAASIALLPLQDRTGNLEAVEAVQREMATRVLSLGPVLDSGKVRQTLRRSRVRRAEQITAENLSQVASELGADWLISLTVHEARSSLIGSDYVPRLTVSGRAYSGTTGKMFWAGFESGSGLTPRTVLGLREIRNTSLMAQWVIGRLVEDLEGYAATESNSRRGVSPQVKRLGRVAIVPFAGLTDRLGTIHSETVTEAVRAVSFRNGMALVSPNSVYETLRRQEPIRWGGATISLREDLERMHQVDTIVTGAVEAFEINASPDGPRPRIAVSMRLIDAHTGRVLWADGIERDIADRPGHFGTRRIYTLGALTVRTVEALTRRLLKENRAPAVEGS